MTTGDWPGFRHYDFDAAYRGDSPAAGVPPASTAPWDTGGPKHNVISWHAAGLVRGDVLDIGCGLDDNAIYLAQQGFAVTGLDISAAALRTAGSRAAAAGASVTFRIGDATALPGYTGAFDTVVDSGMFHCLERDAQHRYLRATHRATRAGATLLLSCFSDANPAPAPQQPRPMVTERTLRDVLETAGWPVTALEAVTVHRAGWGGDMTYWYARAARRDG